MKLRMLILVFLIFSAIGTSAYAIEIKRKVDIASGEKLVRMALDATEYRNSDFTDPPDNYSSDEIFLIYPILGATEGFLAHFAVNPWTGDVWNMDECKSFSNSALQKAQAHIKTRFNVNELREYTRLHNIKPYRIYDLEPCP